MASHFPIDPCLTKPDLLVLGKLFEDIKKTQAKKDVAQTVIATGFESEESDSISDEKLDLAVSSVKELIIESGESTSDDDDDDNSDASIIAQLNALNDPKSATFDPTVFVSFDITAENTPVWLRQYVLDPYTKWARKVVRNETDVVMITHLLLYLTTSIPSAFYLYQNFTWTHGILHWIMQAWFAGSYTLMKHQHIHMNGILSTKYALLDTLFPYVTDPLMGHTWNSYYYHHVKHHHVENNGPGDLSSTLRYQRDDIFHFLHYIGRFYFFIWLDLPRYFIRRNKPLLALKAAFWELGYYATLYLLATQLSFRATLCVFILPLMLMRFGLMVGNWGQHAFVDDVDPDSDFRSSITLIDVASNRYCFNDGYHTSHHLNPRRHWRHHPVSFLKQKRKYAKEQALVFHNIDYIMLTMKLLQKDYMHLAKCLVPIGEQVGMELEEIAGMLRRKTRVFTEEEVRAKYPGAV